jgi:hypothetical protein
MDQLLRLALVEGFLWSNYLDDSVPHFFIVVLYQANFDVMWRRPMQTRMGDISLDSVTPDVSIHKRLATLDLSSARHRVPPEISQVRPSHLSNPAIIPIPSYIDNRLAGFPGRSPAEKQTA